MGLIILVFTCQKHPYKRLLDVAQKTWASVGVKNVKTIFFYGGATEKLLQIPNTEIYEYCTGTSDEYEYQHIKYRKALQLANTFDYDYILRGNISSYFDKKMALQKCKDLPKEKCYYGKDGGGFASGCGHFLTRDVANILINSIGDEAHEAEDKLVGEILLSKGISVMDNSDRHDIYFPNEEYFDTYLYRCKTNEKTDLDRNKDVEAFNKIHKIKLSK